LRCEAEQPLDLSARIWSALLQYLRKDDTLVVWKLDRLGRSHRHLLDTLPARARRENLSLCRQIYIIFIIERELWTSGCDTS
jgi:hypothetical protein